MEFKGRTRSPIELNIAPLIDVVFLLLIFFMLTSSMIKDQALDITLPESSSSAPAKDTEIDLALKLDGTYVLNGSVIAENSLPSRLRPLFKDAADRSVILRSDSNVQVSQLVHAMDLIKEAGGSNVMIATTASAQVKSPE